MKLIFACRQMLKIFSNWFYHFKCVWSGMSKLPKITSLLFLYNMLRSEWCSWFFYIQISMKACYKLMVRFFDEYGQAFLKFPKKQVWNIFNLEMKVIFFFYADKHQSFLTVLFNTLGIKFFYNVTGMISKTWRTWWWGFSSILKALK